MDNKHIPEQVANFLEDNRIVFFEALRSIATEESIDYEINHSILALRGAQAEMRDINPVIISRAAVYHPSNFILYSYILYGIIPSLFCKQVDLRPSTKVSSVTEKVHGIINDVLPVPITIRAISQKSFADLTVDAQLVVFTGKYENSVRVMERHPQALFLFFGAGLNPFVVGPDFDCKYAARKAAESRLFNSGQDCMCPNVYFVHNSRADEFIRELCQFLNLYKEKKKLHGAIGASIFYEGVVDAAKNYLTMFSNHIIHGGHVDCMANLVEPTVLSSRIEDPLPTYEYFCPIFNVVRYENDEEVLRWLYKDANREYMMGASVFGAPTLALRLRDTHTVAENQTLFDIESGNVPFGGCGRRAGYAAFKGNIASRPLLISREVMLSFGPAEQKWSA